MNYQHTISIEPGERGGRPCIRHMRIAVADVLALLDLLKAPVKNALA